MNLVVNTENKQTVADSFERIAKELVLQADLVLNASAYQLIDIEFYYKCRIHNDETTLPHSLAAGCLEAHRFGVDISLGNGENEFGGILIRGLRNTKTGAIKRKGQIKNLIINTAINGNIQYQFLKLKSERKDDIFRTTRINLGERSGEFKHSLYHYILQDPKVLIDYDAKKEEVIRNADLTNSEKNELAGYQLIK